MADGRNKAMWSHTASVLCQQANLHRDKKKHPSPFKVSDIDPYHRKSPASKAPKVKLRSLKGSLFPGQKPRTN